MPPLITAVLSDACPLGPRVERALARDRRFHVERLPCLPAPALAARLERLRLQLLINAGAEIDRDYRLAQWCLAKGVHYLDMVDDRAFVTGIRQLDAPARAAGLLLVSGASLQPGLSAAAVDAHRDRFARLDAIDIAAWPCPGQRFRWRRIDRWPRLRLRRHPGAPPYWFVGHDAADLALLPERYPGVRTVNSRIAVAAAPLPWPRRDEIGEPLAGLHLELTGLGHNGERKRLHWSLLGRGDSAVDIACLPALVLARRLAAGTLAVRGALPCLGLFRLQDCMELARRLEVHCETMAA